MQSSLFTIVISADLAVDIFFWLTAFLSSYFMLNTMHQNEGFLGKVYLIYLNKLMKLWPLYIFTLLFYWKFLPLFGGEGPIFYMYDSMLQCSKYWYSNLLFINNIIPWSTIDTCMHWTWFLANYLQFFLLVPFLVQAYYHRKKYFYISIGVVTFLCILVSIIVIVVNDLSPSYFTYKDEYWSIYYVKPYARLPAFLIGVIVGCAYFSYKKEYEGNILSYYIELVEARNSVSLISTVLGTILCILMVILL